MDTPSPENPPERDSLNAILLELERAYGEKPTVDHAMAAKTFPEEGELVRLTGGALDASHAI